MSKLYCSTCKYYDFNTCSGVDWCKLNDEETGICGHCEREFEDLEEAVQHYDAIVEENDKLWSQKSKPKFKLKQYVYGVLGTDVVKGQIDVFDFYTQRYLVFFGEDIGGEWCVGSELYTSKNEANKRLGEIKNEIL